MAGASDVDAKSYDIGSYSEPQRDVVLIKSPHDSGNCAFRLASENFYLLGAFHSRHSILGVGLG